MPVAILQEVPIKSPPIISFRPKRVLQLSSSVFPSAVESIPVFSACVKISLCKMADEEKTEVTSSRGADWEVVALTASAYAAAPGPDAAAGPDADEFQREQGSSSAMFMSEHFVFPPHEHENLPVELNSSEIHDQPWSHEILPSGEEHDYLDECNENSSEAELSIPSMESQECQTHSVLHAETDDIQIIPSDDENDILEANQNYDMPPDFVEDGKTSERKYGDSSHPCEAWWKRHALSLYKQAKETNSLWSIFMAAALMGLVVLGQQWQKEKFQIQQLKWQFSITNERMNRMMGSINRFRDALVGGHQRSSLIQGSAASNL